MLIVLPSQFTGGYIQTSYEDSSFMYSLRSMGSLAISVVAWFHEATFNSAPPTSGHRLMLVYDLIHRQGHASPRIPVQWVWKERLSATMAEWKVDNTFKGPNKVVCLLDRYYADYGSDTKARPSRTSFSPLVTAASRPQMDLHVQ